MQKRGIILTLVLIMMLVVLSACSTGNDVADTYNRAMSNMKNGQFAEAADELDKISFYEDSVRLSIYCRAHAYAADGKYNEAGALLYELNSYRDSAEWYAYYEAKQAEETAETPEARLYAANLYNREILREFRDASVRSENILSSLYQEGTEAEAGGDWTKASEIFIVLGNYRDSSIRCSYISGRESEDLGEGTPTAYIDAIWKYDAAGTYGDSKERIQNCIENVYAKAEEMIAAKDFDGAEKLYTALGSYCDGDKITGLQEARENEKSRIYDEATALTENGEYREASSLYMRIIGYRDTEEKLYDIADKASAGKQYALSISIFKKLGDEKDCRLRMTNDLYLYGCQLLDEGENNEAAEIFDSIEGIGSAEKYANMARYTAAEKLEAEEKYKEAASAFAQISAYADAEDRSVKCTYEYGIQEKNAAHYANAADIFDSLKDYEDSADQGTDCRYLLGRQYEEKKKWNEAISVYQSMKEYKDCLSRYKSCCSNLGEDQLAAGNAETAYELFANGEDTDGQSRAAFAVAEGLVSKFSLERALQWYQKASKLPETEIRTSMIAESLLNMEEDELSEQYASVVDGSEKSREVLYALAIRSLERKDEDAAMRQLQKAGDIADASERFMEMLNARVDTLVSNEKFDEAAALCAAYGDNDRAEAFLKQKAEKEEEEKKKLAEANKAKHQAKIDEANALLENGEYEKAYAAFRELDDQEMMNETVYRKAEALGQPELYMEILDYSDSREKHYQAGKALLETDPEKAYRILSADAAYSDVTAILYDLADRESGKENYQLSTTIFSYLADLPLDPQKPRSDCRMRFLQDYYQYGLQLQKQGEWKKAATVFDALTGIGEAEKRSLESNYEIARSLEKDEKYAEAAEAFTALGNYSDSAVRARRNTYDAARKMLEAGMYDDAREVFINLGAYKDSPKMVNECYYEKALSFMGSGNYKQAYLLFEALGQYKESESLKTGAAYSMAEEYFGKELYTEAIAEYEMISDYSDSADKIILSYAALGDREIKKAEALLQNGETGKAAEAYQSAYAYYQKTEDTERMKSVALMVAHCYHSMNNLITAIEWYEKDGDEGKTGIARIAEYALQTEREEIAEELAISLNTDEGKAILYQIAEKKLGGKDVEGAIRLFKEADGYLDAGERYSELKYSVAMEKIDAGAFEEAETIAAELGGEYYQKIIYAMADQQISTGNEEESIRLFEAIPEYNDSQEKRNAILYQQADRLINDGHCLEAIDLLDKILNYQDAESKKKEAIYQVAVNPPQVDPQDEKTQDALQSAQLVYVNDMLEAENYSAAVTVLESMEQTPEIKEILLSAKYQLAETLMDEKKYKDAMATYQSILDYKDVRSILISSQELRPYLTIWQDRIKAGDVVALGHNESGKSYGWVVLERSEDHLLLIAKQSIWSGMFMEGNAVRVTWEHSTLRADLNDKRLVEIFDERETEAIRLTKVKAERSSDSAVSPGNNTEDYLFLLNEQEEKLYREYLQPNPDGFSWWLRSPGKVNGQIKTCSSNGLVTAEDKADSKHGIRPALWVDDSVLLAGFTELVFEPEEIAVQDSEDTIKTSLGYVTPEFRKQPLLGVTLQSLTEEDVKNGWPARGLLVIGVEKNKPAYYADIRTGDIIRSVNDTPVETFEELELFMDARKLELLMGAQKTGVDFTFTIQRPTMKTQKNGVYSFRYSIVTIKREVTITAIQDP